MTHFEVSFPVRYYETDQMAVVHHSKHPARMGDVLTAVAEIDKAPLAKLVVRQAVLNQNGEVCADGAVILGFIDSKSFRPVRCPDILANIIENHLNDK